MRGIKTLIVFIICLTTTYQAIGQSSHKVETIDAYCDSVLKNLKGYKYVLLNKEPLGEFGGFLDGYLINDSIVLMSHVIAHTSVYQEYYFFQNGRLLKVRISKKYGKSFLLDNKYFFLNDNIFYYELTSNEKVKRRKLSKELLANAQQYKSIFYSQQGEN